MYCVVITRDNTDPEVLGPFPTAEEAEVAKAAWWDSFCGPRVDAKGMPVLDAHHLTGAVVVPLVLDEFVDTKAAIAKATGGAA